MSEKRYRRPKIKDGEVKLKKGKVDGDVDICIFYADDIPRCDRALIMNALCSKIQYTDLKTLTPRFDPSLIDELELRGYDMDTLYFSIKKKVNKN